MHLVLEISGGGLSRKSKRCVRRAREDSQDGDDDLKSLFSPSRSSSSASEDEATRSGPNENVIIDKTRCLARTWKRELLPIMPQCSKKALPGHEFCSLHCQKLPYGRVDNPIDPCVQARIDKSMKRKQRKSAKRWYCRYFMLSKRKQHGIWKTSMI